MRRVFSLNLTVWKKPQKRRETGKSGCVLTERRRSVAVLRRDVKRGYSVHAHVQQFLAWHVLRRVAIDEIIQVPGHILPTTPSVIAWACRSAAPTWSSRVGRRTSPRYAESMAGGASQAPKRKSFPGEAMALLIMSPCMSTPRTIAAITVGKAAALPDAPLRASGASRFTPVSVHRDQLLCFPEPFTPAVQKLALSA